MAEVAAVEGEVWASPDADLEAVQDVAPLDRELDHFGAYDIAGPRTLTISEAGVEGAGAALSWAASEDFFAPALYDDLTRAEKLSAPSYEAMAAGVRFGIDGIALPAQDEVRTVTTRYERAVIDGETRTGLRDAGLEVSMEAAAFGHVVTRGRQVQADAGPFALADVRWATANATTGRATGTTGSFREAVLAQRAAPRGSERVAPVYAIRPKLGPIDLPNVPGDLPGGPVDFPGGPGDLPRGPGDLPRAPGDLPRGPGDLPRGPGDLPGRPAPTDPVRPSRPGRGPRKRPPKPRGRP